MAVSFLMILPFLQYIGHNWVIKQYDYNCWKMWFSQETSAVSIWNICMLPRPRIAFFLLTITVAARGCDLNCSISIVGCNTLLGVCVCLYLSVFVCVIPLSFTVWQLEYVCSLVIKAKPGTTEHLPTGLEMHIWQTTPHGEKPACLAPLACMTVYGPSPVCSAKHKKIWWRQRWRPLGKQREGKQFISLKIECPSWTPWGSGSFVTDSGGFVYKRGQRKAGKMLFSLNLLFKTMANKGKDLPLTEQQKVPCHPCNHQL